MNDHPLHILLVEDEPLVRELMRDVLSDFGDVVIECDRADAGLAYLEAKGQDIFLLVTDIMTPGTLNGYQLAQIVALRWPNLKVLVTSGYADVNTHRLPSNSVFLAKPWSYHQLEEAVRKLLP